MSCKMLPFDFRTLGAKLQKNILKKYFTSNNQKWAQKEFLEKDISLTEFYSMPMQATFSTANSRIDRNLSEKKTICRS